MLKRFFTAKWQHKNHTIRQQALAEFDSVKDADIIVKMVTDDPSQDIRNQALAKIIEPERLQQLLDKANDPLDWINYAVKLNDLIPQVQSLVTTFSKIKAQWNDQEIIKAIASCKTAELANALLVSSDDSNALFEMAKNAKSIEIRLDAVNKIDDSEVLHRLVKESSNKLVLRAVKQKLAAVKSAQKHNDELQKNSESLVLAMDKLSQQSWLDHQYEIKVKSLVDKWQQNEMALALIESPKLQQTVLELKVKFLTSLDVCYDRILKNQNELQQANLEQDAINKHKALSTQLKKLVAEINEPPQLEQTSLEKFQSIKSASDFLLKSWSQTVTIVKPETKINSEFLALTAELENYFAAWTRLTELETEINLHISLQPLESYAELKHWLDKWQTLERKLSWPTEIVAPDLLLNWLETAKQIKEKYNKIILSQKKKAAYINQKLLQLEKECQRKNLLAANKLSNYISLQLDALNPDFRASIEAKIEKIQPLLEELRDWHLFATTPKKQALCEAMELLQNQSIDPLEKANKVRSLQQQWRELKASNAIADEALWDRFKLASDIAYLPCLAFYAEQDKIKADNLHKKIEICEQLDKLIKDNGWVLNDAPESDNEIDKIESIADEFESSKREKQIDWKNIDQLMSKINQDWKKLQPVPENERVSIQHHYDMASKIIREKIKNEKQSNLNLRCELVEKASQLTSLEDIEKAIKSALSLQKQWKETGLTFFKADREQWFLFRQAIDKVFNKRDELNKSHKEELKSNQQKIIEITQQINELAKIGDLELRASYQIFEEIKGKSFSESELPKASAAKLLSQFEKACSVYQNHFDGLDKRLQKLKFDSLMNGCLLLQKAEEQILSNSLNLSVDEKQQLQQDFEELYLDHNDKDLLNLRLQKILDNQEIQENIQGTNQLLQIALDLEILLAIESPPQYSQERMVIQLEKLKEGMGAALLEPQKNEIVFNALRIWITIGFIEPTARLELESRRAKIFSQLTL